MESEGKTAVILMGYGSPSTLSEVPEYLAGIYEGRPVPDQAMKENMAKYSMFGGKSPSNSILKSLELKLSSHLGSSFIVKLAYKHWKPWIRDVVEEVHRESNKIIGIPLFPFKSKNVEQSYRIQFDGICREKAVHEAVFINGFSNYREFSEMWTSILKSSGYVNSDDTLFLFTAHSLPNCETEEEYRDNFIKAVDLISKSAGIRNYMFAFQSQGKYGKNWCGPRADESATRIQAGIRRVVSVPVGFCYDHLEILYDLDYLVGNSLRNAGFEYLRSGLPNDSDGMVRLLSAIAHGS